MDPAPNLDAMSVGIVAGPLEAASRLSYEQCPLRRRRATLRLAFAEFLIPFPRVVPGFLCDAAGFEAFLPPGALALDLGAIISRVERAVAC